MMFVFLGMVLLVTSLQAQRPVQNAVVSSVSITKFGLAVGAANKAPTQLNAAGEFVIGTNDEGFSYTFSMTDPNNSPLTITVGTIPAFPCATGTYAYSCGASAKISGNYEFIPVLTARDLTTNVKRTVIATPAVSVQFKVN